MRKSPEICPNCGAEVPPNALVCPECGADHKTGWSDFAEEQRLDLPDDEFDYDNFVKEEFSNKKNKGIQQIPLLWRIAAILLIIIFVLFFLKKFF
jgi:uncharacterized membrane protein YvbJ